MKILLISSIVIFTFNAFAEMGKIKITKDSKIKETRETKPINSVNTTNTYPVKIRLDSEGKKLLSLDQVYKKYGHSKEAQKYIDINEMQDLVEIRNNKMK